ncbi:MAG: hypothetical protein EOL95_11890, partial [Bacteroidia bacterium]|nr:hypothetical protein [Bacteroidia bacterium]
MAFQYTFKLNGEALYATLGAMVSEKLEEPLDESNIHIPITVRDYEYKMLGLLEITATDGTITKNFTYLILSDRVKDISKSGFYSHDLTAVEYTVGLDWKLVHTLTFTKPFLNKARAPFLIDETFYAKMLFPKVEFALDYYIGEEIIVPQVGSFVKTETFTTDNENVYIKANGGEYTSVQNLTSGDATLQFNEEGTYEIRVGFLFS